jgi:hypothetical protein
MREEFTEKQKQVLKAIEIHFAYFGRMPYFKELRATTGQSVCNIQYAVEKFLKLGYLEYVDPTRKLHRNYKLTRKQYDWSKE